MLREANKLKIPIAKFSLDTNERPEFCRACYQKERVKKEELETENKTLRQSCDAHVAIKRQRLDRIKELEAEMLEISNQLMDLYDSCQKTAEPEIYGAILGLHQRLEQIQKG